MKGSKFTQIMAITALMISASMVQASAFLNSYDSYYNGLKKAVDTGNTEEAQRLLNLTRNALDNLEKASAHKAVAIKERGTNFFTEQKTKLNNAETEIKDMIINSKMSTEGLFGEEKPAAKPEAPKVPAAPSVKPAQAKRIGDSFADSYLAIAAKLDAIVSGEERAHPKRILFLVLQAENGLNNLDKAEAHKNIALQRLGSNFIKDERKKLDDIKQTIKTEIEAFKEATKDITSIISIDPTYTETISSDIEKRQLESRFNTVSEAEAAYLGIFIAAIRAGDIDLREQAQNGMTELLVALCPNENEVKEYIQDYIDKIIASVTRYDSSTSKQTKKKIEKQLTEARNTWVNAFMKNACVTVGKEAKKRDKKSKK